MGLCVCVCVCVCVGGGVFLWFLLIPKLMMKAFVLTISPSLPIQSSALYTKWIRENSHFAFIGNKNLRLTFERLPSKNTSGIYSSHSEWINSGWTKGITENVNRLCLGLRCFEELRQASESFSYLQTPKCLRKRDISVVMLSSLRISVGVYLWNKGLCTL